MAGLSSAGSEKSLLEPVTTQTLPSPHEVLDLNARGHSKDDGGPTDKAVFRETKDCNCNSQMSNDQLSASDDVGLGAGKRSSETSVQRRFL